MCPSKQISQQASISFMQLFFQCCDCSQFPEKVDAKHSPSNLWEDSFHMKPKMEPWFRMLQSFDLEPSFGRPLADLKRAHDPKRDWGGDKTAQTSRDQ